MRMEDKHTQWKAIFSGIFCLKTSKQIQSRFLLLFGGYLSVLSRCKPSASVGVSQSEVGGESPYASVLPSFFICMVWVGRRICAGFEFKC